MNDFLFTFRHTTAGFGSPVTTQAIVIVSPSRDW